MIYVIDTHPVIWHLEDNPKLSTPAADVFRATDSEIVLPSIVLAEIWFLYQRKKINSSPQDVHSRILASVNCSIYPLDEAVLDKLPAGLDIHDAIIVATDLVYRDVMQKPTQLITRDRAIADSKLIDVIW